ncbi:MAG: hypothetical protein ACREC5_03565 [Thermoplasmata archaeon]
MPTAHAKKLGKAAPRPVPANRGSPVRRAHGPVPRSSTGTRRKPPARPSGAGSPAKSTPAPVAPSPPALSPRGDARRHVLSLSFLRDGDEFLARLETDAGQITEMKNRSLDQLLTLVAGELEDLLD